MEEKFDPSKRNQASELSDKKMINRRDALILSSRGACAFAVLAMLGQLVPKEAEAEGSKKASGKKKAGKKTAKKPRADIAEDNEEDIEDDDTQESVLPQYEPDKFADQIWDELDPSNHESVYFDIMADNYLPDRYPLIYSHNVKGKIEKKGVNIPTPSLVFELAKFCSRGAKDKMLAVQERAKVIPNIKEVASPDHPDYPRVMQIYNAVSSIDANNRKTWPPLVKITGEVVKKIQQMVMMEQKASKSLKCESDANEEIGDVRSIIPVARNAENNTELDRFEELLSWTRTYTYECINGASYNDAPRPQTNSKLLEGAFMLRNVINVLYRVSYERHKALVEVKSCAAYLNAKNPNKKRLNQIAQLKTSKALRDGWANLIRTKDTEYGKKGLVIELIETMVQAYNFETQMAKSIKRCKIGNESEEPKKEYLDRAKEQLLPNSERKSTETSSGSFFPGGL